MLEAEMVDFIRQTYEFYPPNAVDLPIAEQRRLYDRYAASLSPRQPLGVSTEDADFGNPPMALRAYRDSEGGRRGTIVYLHGGGFVLGGLNSHDMITGCFAARSAATVIAVDYRLAPEHPFPAAIDDALAVVRGVLQHTMPFPVNRGPVVLAGDSAGANLCAAIALDLAADQDVRLNGLILFYPSLGADPTPPARDEHADAPMLTLADARWYYQVYLGNSLPNARSSPLLAPSLAGLPPTLLLPAESDPLRDDAVEFHRRLLREGGRSELMLGRGLVHGYLRALGRSPGVDALVGRAVAFAREHLEQARG
jgi:acetyl esterase/lipase